jgi:predicted transcriptional regulator of viral defense system
MAVDMAVQTMVNENYEPNQHEDRVLEFLEREPCGRVTNRYVREEIEMPAERVDPALNNLEKAGWVKRLTRGFYELVEDPREN